MTIAALITEGVGSYGDVAHIITDGLDISGVVVTAPATILTEGFGALSSRSPFLVMEGFGALVSAVTPTPGGGSGRRYPVGNLDLETWRKEKRLTAKVERIQKQIQKKRDQLDLAPSYERIKELKRQIVELNKKLLKLLEMMDEARKAYAAEEDEVMAIYEMLRTLH